MDTFAYVFAGGLLVLALEKLFPHHKLVSTDNWIPRAIFFNSMQLLFALLSQFMFEQYLIGCHSMFHVGESVSPFFGGVLTFFVTTWVFYWWHRVRHENKFLWNWVHQIHHSPQRIEVITSFYKHPIEIMLNSIILAIIAHPILGLSSEANSWAGILLAYSEFFYHMNIGTPHFLGYFIQRPESHLLHHERDKRFCYNNSDISLWDILGGTFSNPRTTNFKVGFSNQLEVKVVPMLFGEDVLYTQNTQKGKWNNDSTELNGNRYSTLRAFMFALILVVGCLNTTGYIMNNDNIRGIAFATSSSPLPLVFSVYNGIETFSTTYEFDLIFANGTHYTQQMDHKLYEILQGPYNRRNVIGAIFSHGPFFDKPNMIEIRQQILYWGMCYPGILAKEFGFGGGMNDKIMRADIIVKSKTIGNENKRWVLSVTC